MLNAVQHKTIADEQSLIKQAQYGNQMAFKTLYDRNVDGLFRFLMQFCHDRDTVADWVQQSFTKAFLNITSFKMKSSFRTWLFGIGINEMKMATRRTHTLELVEDVEVFHQSEEWTPELNWQLREHINRLDEQKRMVFILAEVEGYSHQEIAGLLELKESTSRTILTRAKAQLRHWITGATP